MKRNLIYSMVSFMITLLFMSAITSAVLQAQSVSLAPVQSTVLSGLSFPAGVAVDAAGDVFIADISGHSVTKVPADGGTPVPVGSGWGEPEDVAIDGAANIFVVDFTQDSIVKIAPDGTQTNIGSGVIHSDGLALDKAGDIFVAETLKNQIVEFPAGGGAPATLATGLNFPTGIAVDAAGDVFFTNGGNQAIEVPAGGGAQITVGSGLNGPSGVAVDAAGDVFIADEFNNRVVEVPAGGGAQITVGGGLSQPLGVAVDTRGSVFISDSNNGRVVEVQRGSVNLGSANICSAGQTSPAPCSQSLTLNFNVTASGALGTPNVLTLGAPNLDFTLASGSTCTGAVSAGSTCTVNVTFVPVYPGARNGAVQLTNASGQVISTTLIYGTGVGPQIAYSPSVPNTLLSGLNGPTGVAVDGTGTVFAADSNNNRVVKISPNGLSATAVGGLNYPFGIAVDGAGNLYIANIFSSNILKVTPSGGQTTVGRGFGEPVAVAVDGAGNVFVGDARNQTVVKVAPDGTQTTVASGFDYLAGIAVDGLGNLFVADYDGGSVFKISPTSVRTTIGGGWNTPNFVEVDGAGDVFVTDANSGELQMVAPDGTQTVLASGLHFPYGVAVDATGNVFFASLANNTIAELQRSQPPKVSFASTVVGATSSPQSVAVQNIGNAALTFSTPSMGYNPSIAANFTYDNSSTCPQLSPSAENATLAIGSSCTIAIDFSPTVPGSITGSAVATDNNLNVTNATQSIQLSGAATQTLVSIGVTGLVNATAGTGQNLTVTAYDADGNVDTAYNGTIHLTTSDPQAELNSSFTLVNGTRTAADSIKFHTAGSQTVTATDTATSIAGTSAPVTITAAAASKLAIQQGDQQSATVNTAFATPLQVLVTDDYSNPVSGVQVAFAVPGSGASATLSMAAATGSDGTTSVTATANANSGNYIVRAAAPRAGQVNFRLTNNAASQTITFAPLPASVVYGSAPITLSAAASSNLTVTFSVLSGPATVSGTTLTITGAGQVVVAADQSGSPTYAAAPEVTQNLQVTPAAPSISFSVANQTYGAAPFTVAATSNSTGAITYSVVSGPATVSGSTVTLTGAGTVVLQASQAANGNYSTGTQNANFNVSTAAPSISFSVGNVTYGVAPFSVAATSNSTGAITYSVVSGPATISGSTVTITGAGQVVLQASQAANGNYSTATQNATFTVNPAAPSITFSVGSVTFGVTPFSVAATSNSAGAITYSVVSGPASVAGNSVTITGAGTVVLQASQAANGNYTSGTKNATFAVNAAAPSITFSVGNVNYGVAPFSVAATSNSAGAITYSVVSGPATINGSVVTITGAGAVVLEASQAANGNYSAGIQTASFTVSAGAAAISFSAPNQTYGAAPFQVNATSSSPGSFTYSVVSGPATVVGNTVTINGAGTVVLQASQAAGGSYSAGSQNATFAVSPAVLSVIPVPQNGAPTITVGYGNAMPTLSFFYGITGFVNGDTAAVVSGAPSLSVNFGSSTPSVGTYPFNIGVGTLSAANYTFTTQNGTVSVVPASIVVKPNSTTTKYGTAPALSYVITGLKYGQTASVLSSAPIVTTTAAMTSPVGNYPISVNVNGITSPNYTIVAGPNATLAVTPVNLQVKALSNSTTYGSPLPALSYAISGFVNGDNASVVTGTPVISTTAVKGSAAGTYPISASVSGMSATNYTFSPGTNAVLTVFPASLNVAATAESVTHGSPLPKLVYTVSGYVNGDPASVLTGAPSLTTTAVQGSPAGSYPISISAGTLTATNYTFKLIASTLTIH